MQILIVGAGIAGLSLAKALEQRGMAADLVERQTGELAVGAGLYLVGKRPVRCNNLACWRMWRRRPCPLRRSASSTGEASY